MIVPVMAISNLVLTQQIYSEETNGAHAHYREPVPLKEEYFYSMIACVQDWPNPLKKKSGRKIDVYLFFRGGAVCTQANFMTVV